MMTPRCAMLFAAGRGTRMAPLTAKRPKPLINVAGRPLIEHALDLLTDVERIVVNTHFMAGMIERYLQARTGRDFLISHEPELLETGGGIKAARDLLGEGPILTLNTDAVWRAASPLSQLLARIPQGAEACLLLARRQDAVGHCGAGDFFLGPDGRLTRRGTAAQAPFVYTGLQVLRPGIVYDWPEKAFSQNACWDVLIERGALFGVVLDGQWCDVGQPESVAVAERMLAA